MGKLYNIVYAKNEKSDPQIFSHNAVFTHTGDHKTEITAKKIRI